MNRKFLSLNSNIFIVFTVIFVLQISRYYNLNSRIADLGFFESNALSIFTEPAKVLFGHFQPILFIYGLFYKFFPGNISIFLIFAIQDILLAYSIYCIAKYFNKSIGILLLLSPVLWFITINDFHVDFLVIPITTLFFILCNQGKFVYALLFSLFFILIKEVYILLISSCSLYILCLNYKSKNIIKFLSIFFIFLGLIIYFLVNNYILDFLIPNYLFNSLGNINFNAKDTNLLLRIIESFSNLYSIFNDTNKIKYLVILFGIFSFLSIICPLPLIVALPVLSISIISDNPGYHSISNHYTSALVVPLAISAANGLNKLLQFNLSINKLFVVYTFPILIHLFFSPSPISRYWWGSNPDFNYSNYIYSLRNNNIRDALHMFIPSERNITVTSLNSLNYYIISNRNVILPFNLGISAPYIQPDFKSINFKQYINYILNKDFIIPESKYNSEFVIIDLKRKIFLIDQGCPTHSSQCSDINFYEKFNKELISLYQNYEVIFYYDQFYIYKRK